VAGFDGSKTVRVAMSFWGDELNEMQNKGRRDAAQREKQV
jgi:hypothetical protein